MTDTTQPQELLSYCGLYCGNCTGYTRGMPFMGTCQGCRAGGGNPQCPIRLCNQEKGYTLCSRRS